MKIAGPIGGIVGATAGLLGYLTAREMLGGKN
jgi:hypothetical protein